MNFILTSGYPCLPTVLQLSLTVCQTPAAGATGAAVLANDDPGRAGRGGQPPLGDIHIRASRPRYPATPSTDAVGPGPVGTRLCSPKSLLFYQGNFKKHYSSVSWSELRDQSILDRIRI
jgi:hypothetical protein